MVGSPYCAAHCGESEQISAPGTSAGPANTVPIARPLPSGFGTLVATRMYSSPPFTKSIAVIPRPSFCQSHQQSRNCCSSWQCQNAEMSADASIAQRNQSHAKHAIANKAAATKKARAIRPTSRSRMDLKRHRCVWLRFLARRQRSPPIVGSAQAAFCAEPNIGRSQRDPTATLTLRVRNVDRWRVSHFKCGLRRLRYHPHTRLRFGSPDSATS